MHNMQNVNMQNNMQINMQNMLAICRFGADCLVLTVICRICQIICSICPICYGDFQYAQYALPTLLMMLNLSYQDLGQVRNMDKRQHGHCFLSAHFAELSTPPTPPMWTSWVRTLPTGIQNVRPGKRHPPYAPNAKPSLPRSRPSAQHG